MNIDKSAQIAKLLVKWSLNLFKVKWKAVSKPKSCERPRKKLDLPVLLSQDNTLDPYNPS